MDISKLKELSSAKTIDSVFKGGSNAKGFSDTFSDIDVGVIVSSVEKGKMDIYELLGEPTFTEIKQGSTAMHYEVNGFCRIELRLVSQKAIYKTLSSLLSGVYIDQAEQDLLQNIKNGEYIIESQWMAKVKHAITFTKRLRNQIFDRNLPLIQNYDFEKLAARGDSVMFHHYLGLCAKAILILLPACHFHFYNGLKHQEKIISKFDCSFRRIWTLLLDAQQNMDGKKANQFVKESRQYFESAQMFGTVKHSSFQNLRQFKFI